MEKTGAPLSAAKEVKFDLTEKDETTAIHMELKNGRPTGLTVMGADPTSDKTAVAKMLRQAANKLSAE